MHIKNPKWATLLRRVTEMSKGNCGMIVVGLLLLSVTMCSKIIREVILKSIHTNVRYHRPIVEMEKQGSGGGVAEE